VRDAYVFEHVRNGIPFQIRALRKDRDWSQLELAEAARTSRTVITRIEDPNYGSLTLKTLYQIASAFDVALLVKFIPFSRLIREYEDVSSKALTVKSVDDPNEILALHTWADADQPESSTTINTTVFQKATEGIEIVNASVPQRKDCVISIPSQATKPERVAA
jgi:transcriptional regulator with XRE-family HTH domain